MSCPDAAVLAAERGEGCLTSPVLSKPARGVSARRPRRPRRARVACRSSGVPSRLCRAVCLTQSAAARGRHRRCAANAAAVCVTIAFPLCPRRVVELKLQLSCTPAMTNVATMAVLRWPSGAAQHLVQWQ
uniref:Uncharacterized protein n=1 Tax=Emiliania huxleyi TaxID=2903 RepID=A0A7S3X7N1_EMIHU